MTNTITLTITPLQSIDTEGITFSITDRPLRMEAGTAKRVFTAINSLIEGGHAQPAINTIQALLAQKVREGESVQDLASLWEQISEWEYHGADCIKIDVHGVLEAEIA